MCVLGGNGLLSAKRIYGLVDDMYQANVLSLLAISDAQNAVVDVRVAMLRVIVEPAIKGTSERVRAALSKEAAAWSAYYPSKVNSDQERSAANAYMSERAKTLPLIEKELAMIKAGDQPDELKRLQIEVVGPAIGQLATSMDELARINVVQARSAAGMASDSYARTRYVSTGTDCGTHDELRPCLS